MVGPKKRKEIAGEVKEDSAWNQWLRDAAPALVADALVAAVENALAANRLAPFDLVGLLDAATLDGGAALRRPSGLRFLMTKMRPDSINKFTNSNILSIALQ